MLTQFADHPVLGLTGQVHIQVDAVPGVDQQTQPAGRDLGLVPVGRHQQVSVVDAVDTDGVAVGQVDAGGGVKFVDGDVVQLPPGGHVLGQHLFDLLGKGLLIAGPAAEDVVEDFRRRLILAVGENDLVPTLPQIVGRRPDGGLEGGNGLLLFMAPFGAGRGLMLKNQEKAPGDGLP